MRVYLSALLALIYLSSFATISGAGHEPGGRDNSSAQQLYRSHCVSCHGNDGKAKTSKGKYSHARDLTDVEWQNDVSDARIFNSIMNGRNVRGNMPAFSDKLNEQQVNALVGFVRGLKARSSSN